MNVTTIKLLRHRQTKGAATDRFDLRGGKPVLYSTYSPRQGLLMLRIWAYRSLSLIGDYANLPT